MSTLYFSACSLVQRKVLYYMNSIVPTPWILNLDLSDITTTKRGNRKIVKTAHTCIIQFDLMTCVETAISTEKWEKQFFYA